MRLIDAEGHQVGVVSLREALAEAEKQELDLVEVSGQANPPVCRIMNYGKYLFELRKKSKNRAKKVQVKELKLRTTTDVGDYLVKLRKAQEFLGEGNKVRLVVRFRGREMAYQQQGSDILKRFANDLSGIGVIEQTARTEGKQMSMVLAPDKGKKSKQEAYT